MIQSALPFSTISLLAAALAACATVPDAPTVEGTPLREGSVVALDQPVQVGAIVATPKEVVEDSRCPINARCIHAGRLIVRTRLDGAGWRETIDLELGKDFGTHGTIVALVSGEPQRVAGQPFAVEDYRFGYEARQFHTPAGQ